MGEGEDTGQRAGEYHLALAPCLAGIDLNLLDQGAEMVRSRTGLPIHTATYANHAALEALGARRVGIVTPFDDAANENVRDAYEACGFEVSGICGLNRPGFDQIASTPDQETVEAVAKVAANDVDAVVQVGTGMPMLHHIAALESRFNLPIVASNVSVYWQGLRAAGIEDRIPGAGRLLEIRQVSKPNRNATR